MKILHTADWHIGKKLHKYELAEDFDLFIDWLCSCIKQEQIDVLLVSGDVFDLANPSSEARKQYYRALMQLRQVHCKIILTGGNHDSPSMLDAPKEILRELDMHVIGGLPEQLENCVIPISDKEGKVAVVVAALPYLRDPDLRLASEGKTYDDRMEEIQKGIQHIFSEAAEICKNKFPDIPAMAMGHLFAAGVETSTSEREIQIGNQAAFSASQFGEYFKYIALGHIHKPQKVSAPVPTYYSGSPLPLSFSERKDEKRILIIDTEKGWIPESIAVPEFRKLKRVSGTIEEIKEKLQEFDIQYQLESLLEVVLQEENYDADKIYQLDELVSNFEIPGYKIVKHRANFENQIRGTGDLYHHTKQLADLTPREIFQELVGRHEYKEETRMELVSAFDEILEELHRERT